MPTHDEIRAMIKEGDFSPRTCLGLLMIYVEVTTNGINMTEHEKGVAKELIDHLYEDIEEYASDFVDDYGIFPNE